MANKERGEVSLVARDKTYTLVMTTNGACELENACGRSLDDIFAGALRGKLVDVRWMIWGTLQAHHADEIKTPQDAGNFIDDAGGLLVVANAINGFMQANADTSTDKKAGKSGAPADPPDAQAVNGNDSTLTLVASA